MLTHLTIYSDIFINVTLSLDEASEIVDVLTLVQKLKNAPKNKAEELRKELEEKLERAAAMQAKKDAG